MGNRSVAQNGWCDYLLSVPAHFALVNQPEQVRNAYEEHCWANNYGNDTVDLCDEPVAEIPNDGAAGEVHRRISSEEAPPSV
jgi:hypothetical protein